MYDIFLKVKKYVIVSIIEINSFLLQLKFVLLFINFITATFDRYGFTMKG